MPGTIAMCALHNCNGSEHGCRRERRRLRRVVRLAAIPRPAAKRLIMAHAKLHSGREMHLSHVIHRNLCFEALRRRYSQDARQSASLKACVLCNHAEITDVIDERLP